MNSNKDYNDFVDDNPFLGDGNWLTLLIRRFCINPYPLYVRGNNLLLRLVYPSTSLTLENLLIYWPIQTVVFLLLPLPISVLNFFAYRSSYIQSIEKIFELLDLYDNKSTCHTKRIEEVCRRLRARGYIFVYAYITLSHFAYFIFFILPIGIGSSSPTLDILEWSKIDPENIFIRWTFLVSIHYFFQFFIAGIFFPFIKVLGNFVVYIFDLYFVSTNQVSLMISRTILFILFEIEEEKNLRNVQIRKSIIARIRVIENLNYLLVQKIISSSSRKVDRRWIRNHYEAINFFFREKARCIAAPNELTHQQLRQDFRDMFYLYNSGLHGRFNWELVNDIGFSENILAQKERQYESIRNKTYQIIFAFVPLALVIFFAISETPILSIESSPFIFVGIAWLFLVFDKVLDLGVIESLIRIAQGFRDLSK